MRGRILSTAKRLVGERMVHMEIWEHLRSYPLLCFGILLSRFFRNLKTELRLLLGPRLAHNYSRTLRRCDSQITNSFGLDPPASILSLLLEPAYDDVDNQKP